MCLQFVHANCCRWSTSFFSFRNSIVKNSLNEYPVLLFMYFKEFGRELYNIAPLYEILVLAISVNTFGTFKSFLRVKSV